MADDLTKDRAGNDRVSPSEAADKGDELGSQVLEALRGSDPERSYEPVAEYVVTRVEDILTAVPGDPNVSRQLMDVISRYGFIPLSSVKGHKSVLGHDQGEEIAAELTGVLGGNHADPAQVLNTWITQEFFKRHLERTDREPEVWHLSSGAGAVQILFNGPGLTSRRLGQLITEVIRPAIDELQRQRGKAGDHTDKAAAIEAKLKELHLFEIALGLVQVSAGEESPTIHPGRGRNQQLQGWSPSRAEVTRPNIASLQQLGLLAVPVLTEEEMLAARPSG